MIGKRPSLKPSHLKPTRLKPSHLRPSRLKPSHLRPSRLKPSHLRPSRLKRKPSQHHIFVIPTQLACEYLKGHLTGRSLDWFDVLGYKVLEEKATDYAQLKQALTEQFPVVRNRSELETSFYASYQNPNQRLSDFVYELVKIHKQLKLEMADEKLLDHFISRLEPQLLDYVEVRHPQTTSMQIIDEYEMFINKMTRGPSHS
ncbi:uncharacterized protein TNCV_4605241 [Trichonephila clavipes]|nr:uncharacterized protein TNCV_4605241 [Trichonephila clavipes]